MLGSSQHTYSSSLMTLSCSFNCICHCLLLACLWPHCKNNPGVQSICLASLRSQVSTNPTFPALRVAGALQLAVFSLLFFTLHWEPQLLWPHCDQVGMMKKTCCFLEQLAKQQKSRFRVLIFNFDPEMWPSLFSCITLSGFKWCLIWCLKQSFVLDGEWPHTRGRQRWS